MYIWLKSALSIVNSSSRPYFTQWLQRLDIRVSYDVRSLARFNLRHVSASALCCNSDSSINSFVFEWLIGTKIVLVYLRNMNEQDFKIIWMNKNICCAGRNWQKETHCVLFCDIEAIHMINLSSRFCGTGATMELVFVNNAIFQVYHFVNWVTQRKPKEKKHKLSF